jgi:hypothetical protein
LTHAAASQIQPANERTRAILWGGPCYCDKIRFGDGESKIFLPGWRYAHEIEILSVVLRLNVFEDPASKNSTFSRFEEHHGLLDPVKGDPERMALLFLGSEAGLRQGELVLRDLAALSQPFVRRSWCGRRPGGE